MMEQNSMTEYSVLYLSDRQTGKQTDRQTDIDNNKRQISVDIRLRFGINTIC